MAEAEEEELGVEVKLEEEEEEEEEEDTGYIQSGRRYKCLTCNKTFPSVPRVLRHLKSHGASTGDGLTSKLTCPSCRKEFPDRGQLRKHQAGLRKHERIHSGVRPHACPHCSKAFLGASDLRKHLKTHMALENRAPDDTVLTATITTYEPLLSAHIHHHPHDDEAEAGKEPPSDCFPEALTEPS
ncbi:hypothetical protein JD844_001284 [Phrynosoma platyrhinos]|uniref:C2H2-type domain-containing protein n=1 Tax=Phrynosoma platyrhinos TaxID=52577 RepID=A0ABQ7TAX1_PHRPL|nr:hypothetical protein JD844_001284 [Phrynosoma platyrhinos]